MYIALFILLFIALATVLFLKSAPFGKLASGARLDRIKKSPNFRDGSFQNISNTPNLTEGVKMSSVLIEFFFKKKPWRTPKGRIPSARTDLLNLDPATDILVWFGHSSYFIQIDGKRILVDPVFSGAVTPLPFGNKAFKGADDYSAEDMPEIDFLFISHDHWDHLDYETIKKLKPKIKKIITGLGTGAHLEHWGLNQNIVIEKDWNETVELGDGFIVNTVSARHFSGRGLSRNKSLWMSFVLQTPTMKFFLGGDSGFDRHFEEIGNRFGPFDLAILENGQYNINWRYIHMLPDEILRAARSLRAKRILPVHSSKFALANHAWDEPLSLILKNNEIEKLNIITPRIGEMVELKNDQQQFTKWWEVE